MSLVQFGLKKRHLDHILQLFANYVIVQWFIATLAGIPATLINRLQSVLSAAARFSSVFIARLVSRTLLSVSTCYAYPSEFSSSLWSLSTEPFTALLFNICPTYCVTLLTYRQDVVFDCHCSLPNDITSAPSLPVFRRKLKTYLFQRSYRDIVIAPQWLLEVFLTQATINKLLCNVIHTYN